MIAFANQSYQCDDGKVIVEPKVHLGHSSRFESQTKGQKGRDPSDADGCINIGLQPGHDVGIPHKSELGASTTVAGSS
jgi:hypothetical protein